MNLGAELVEPVGNYPYLAAAQLAQSVLAASGIDSEIPDEYLSGIDWQMGLALGGIELRVMPENAEAARAILASMAVELDSNRDDPDESASPTCEVCSGDGPEAPRWKHRLKAACMLFSPLLLVYAVANLIVPAPKCHSCGRT